MTVLTAPVATRPGWLRGPGFDLSFIAGIAAVAVASGLAVAAEPRLFLPILAADLWLLGYHHVVATYTRLCFDAESFRRHRFLLLWLPLIVLGAVLALGYGVGLWVLASVYLYWQWFHYTRQSWGVAQVYRRKAPDLVDETGWLAKAAFYLPPIWGILHRSHQDPGMFLGLELRVLPVPAVAVEVAGAAAVLAVAVWAGQRFAAWRQGRLPLAHTLYMLSHFGIFTIAYIAIDDIDAGWLVVNIWHNAQYIAFVWLYNNNRFKTGIDPKARFLSAISQNGRMWLYLLVCCGLSTVAYLLIGSLAAAIVAPIVIYQAINFHHYVVDALIWKVRKPAMRQTLGLAG